MNHPHDTRFLNIMKLLMAFFVMVVHFSPFKTIHPILHHVSIHGFPRIVVPFFFLCSGYLLSSHGVISPDRLRKTLKKLVSLYLFWTLLHLPLIILELTHFPNAEPLWISLPRSFFFEGSFLHLWYLLASIIGLVIVTSLLKVFSITQVLFLSLILYIIGVLGDSYYGFSIGLRGLSDLMTLLFQFIRTTRNGLFFAPIYLSLGMFIKKNPKVFSMWTLSLIFIIILGLNTAEVLWLKGMVWAKDYNLTFTSLPLSLITFLISLQIKVNFDTTRFKEIAATLFYIHIWVYVLVQFVLTGGDTTYFKNYGMDGFLITVVLTTVITLFIHKFKHIPFIRNYFM
ncbi:MAG: acyltransferase family protein [Erysipelotrichia bacterium]|jgi:serine/alanine racemase|nr:acyltransferase family protein [Erysipelotrichia bacterium]